MDIILTIAGATIFAVLGVVHIILTLFTDQFSAQQAPVNDAMQQSTLVMTEQTSVWKAWLGFNMSHSFSLIMVGAVYLPLALFHPELLRSSVWFSWLPLMFCAVYIGLAKIYLFNIPLIGFSLAGLCFLSAKALPV